MSTATPTKRPSFALIAAGLTVLGVAAGTTLAAWTDQAQMEASFETGSFGIQLNGEEGNPAPVQVAFSATKLQPGDTSTATITISNTGTEDAYVVLDRVDLTGGAGYAAALTGAVSTIEEGQLGGGSLGALSTAGQEILIASGGERQITTAVTLPADADNDIQGQTVDALFTWVATAEDPTPTPNPGGGGGDGDSSGGGDSVPAGYSLTYGGGQDDGASWASQLGVTLAEGEYLFAPIHMAGGDDTWGVVISQALVRTLDANAYNAGTGPVPLWVFRGAPGDYTIPYTVIDPDGGSHSTQATIHVN